MKKIICIISIMCLIFHSLAISAQTVGSSVLPSRLYPGYIGAEVVSHQIPRPTGIDPYSGNSAGNQAFAKALPIDVSFPANIVADTLPTGLLYRLCLTSPDAFSLGLCISGMHLDDGVQLYFYGAEGNFSIGPITNAGCPDGNLYRTPQIPGSQIYVEMIVPYGLDADDFTITKLYYDFTNLIGGTKARSKDFSSSYNVCSINEDINSSFGDDYQALKHSVVRYTFEYQDYLYYCSGVLVNTTLCDATPYLLTAAHCVCNQSVANTMVSYFNFELESGSNSGYGKEGTIFSSQTLEGATIIATAPKESYIDKYGKESTKKYPALDFTLLQLPDIPASYKPYFAGIHVSQTDDSQHPFSIHHPGGGQKCISITDSPVYNDNYPDEDDECHYKALSHWHVDQWNVGTTQGGSSGAPLFNDDNLVIGTLSGGYASCYDPSDDFFAQICKSWDYYPASDNQLRYWITPNCDAMDIMPFDPYCLENPLPKSHLVGTCENDSSVIHLSWGVNNGKSLFSSDFDSIEDQQQLDGLFYANIDHNTSASDLWAITSQDSNSGSQSILSVKDQSSLGVSHYLVLPKLRLTGNEVLSFYARSSTGESTLRISYNTRSYRFQKLSEITIGNDWQLYEIDLSALGSSTYYLNINNVTSGNGVDSLFIDDLVVGEVSTSTDTATCTGYKLYCNNELLRQFNDISISSYDFDISRGNTYNFYVVNLYGDNGESGYSNIVTVTPGYVRGPSTATGEIKEIKETVGATIYPNPTCGSIYMVIDKDIPNVYADVFDNGGRILKSINLGDIASHQPNMLDIQGLGIGNYLLVVRSNQRKIYSSKFVVYK